MEPEDGLHDHMDGCGQIVAPARMGEFVREDGFDVLVLKAFGKHLRP